MEKHYMFISQAFPERSGTECVLICMLDDDDLPTCSLKNWLFTDGLTPLAEVRFMNGDRCIVPMNELHPIAPPIKGGQGRTQASVANDAIFVIVALALAAALAVFIACRGV